MELAPIVLFVYNRPWHTEQTLNALKLNNLANESVLYIYCDGPKADTTEDDLKKIEAVRDLVKQKQWCKEVQIIERTKNVGLAANIIEGVTNVVEKHGGVIVLEDDIVTSVGFLKFMNDALNLYQENKEVMHISGFMYPHKEKLPETFFFNVPLCWGWATWKDSWKHFNNDSISLWNKLNIQEAFNEFDKFGGDYLSSQLAHNVSGRLNTWFIKWHASVFLKKGYTLYPSTSLVDNIGFDNSGVHNGEQSQFKNQALADYISVTQIPLKENNDAEKIIKSFYSQLIKSKKKVHLNSFFKNKIRGLLYRLLPELKAVAKSNLNNNSGIINKDSYVGKNCKVYPKARLLNSIIGSYTYISENSYISNTIIGKFCSIGPNLICGWGIHPTNGISTHPMFYSAKQQNGITLSVKNKIQERLPIIIGHDVLIGMNVKILDGVKIGNGAVIGAGTIVSKDIPDYAVAYGNPIKIHRYRFEQKIIDKLLEMKWWDLPKEELLIVEKYLFDINEFLKVLEERKKNVKKRR